MAVDRRIVWIYDTSAAAAGAKSLAGANEAISASGKAAMESIRLAAAAAKSYARELEAESGVSKSAISVQASLNASLRATLETIRQGPAALDALNAKRREEIVLAKAGIQAETGLGQALGVLRDQYRQTEAEIEKVVVEHERATLAAEAEASAESQLAAVLTSLAAKQVRTTETIAAERSGAAAVAALNREYAIQNQLLEAGVALRNADGQFVVTNEEGAASVRQRVAALQEEEAVLARLQAERRTAAGSGSTGSVAAQAAATTAAAEGEGKLAAATEAGTVASRARVAGLTEQAAALARTRAEQEAVVESERRASRISQDLSQLRAVTLEMQARAKAIVQGDEALAAFNRDLQVQSALLHSGAAVTTPQGKTRIVDNAGAAQITEEIRAQQALTAARLKDAAAAEVQRAAQSQLQSLSRDLSTTSRSATATSQGPAAVAALNRELEVENRLLAAGAAELDAQGRVVVLYEEQAAAIRGAVSALQSEQAALAEVRSQQEAAAVSARRVGEEGAAGAGIFSSALGEVLQALKYIVVYGAIFAGAGLFKEVVAGALEYESSLTRLRTLVGLTAQEVDGFRASIHNASTETGQSADENAKALFAITSSGLRGAAANEALEASAKGAAIGLGDQTTVARAATAAVLAYGAGSLSAKGATDILIATAREGNVQVDQLAGSLGRVIPIASTVGVSYAQVGAAVASMTRLGLSADEAVTGLRGTLSALSLKEGKSAEATLKSVGFSVAGLRQEIKEKGLAQALVDLVQRFNGNEDALAKIIPNVRALAEVLGNAKNQGQNYVEIQDRINASIGHATDEAFELEKHDPSFVWKQAGIALEEVGRALGESVLPTIVDVATEVRKAAADGAFAAWAQGIGGAFSAVVSGAAILGGSINALVPLVAAWGAGAIVTGAATGLLTTATTALGVAVLDLDAAIAENPFGALLVAAVALYEVLDHSIASAKAVDQAFLDEVDSANRDAVALAGLRDQYVLVQKARDKFRGPSQGAEGASKDVAASPQFQIQLSAAPQSWLGQFKAIQDAYASATSAAGDDKKAVDAVKASRDYDTKALLEHMQAYIGDTNAAIAHSDQVLAENRRQYDEARSQLKGVQAAQAQLRAGAAPLEAYANTAEYAQNLAAKESDLNNKTTLLSNSINVQSHQLTTQKEVVKQLTIEHDSFAKGQQQSAAATDKASKAEENFHAQLQKSIDVRTAQAAGIRLEAAAELIGSEAVRQATIARQQEVLIIAAKDKAKEKGTKVTDDEIARIKASVVAESDANLEKQKSTATERELIQAQQTRRQATASVTDALAGNSVASKLLTASLSAENTALSNGEGVLKAGLIILSKDGQLRVDRARAIEQEKLASEREVEVIKVEFQARNDLAISLAKLEDARNQSGAALDNEQTRQKAATLVQKLGYEGNLLLTAGVFSYVYGVQQKTKATDADTAATQHWADAQKAAAEVRAQFTDWQSQAVFAAKYGSELAGIYQQYGLLSQAEEEQQIQATITARKREAGANADQLAIEQQVRAEHRLIDTEKQVWADAAIAKWIAQPFDDAWSSIQSGFWDNFNSELVTGEANWKSFAQESEKALLQAIEQGVIRFVEGEEVKQAEALKTLAIQEAAGAANGESGGPGVGGGLSRIGNFSGGGGAGTTGLFSGGTPVAGGASGGSGLFGGSAYGGGAAGGFAAVGAWVAVFAAVYFAGQAWLRHITGAFTSATLAFEGDGKLAVNAFKGGPQMDGVISALQGVGKEAAAFLEAFDAEITGLEGSVSVSKKGRNTHNDFWVTYAGGLVKDFGRDADAAFQFALVQAIKQSDQRGLDPLTKAAINDSAAQTESALQADAAFGQTLSRQNFDQLLSQMQGNIDTFHSQFQQELTLYKNDSAALFQAISSSVTKLSSSIWDSYYSLTGKQEDPKAKQQRLADEFNAEKALAIAQIEIARAQILALEASLKAQGAYTAGVIAGGHTFIAVAKAMDLATKPLAGGIDDILARLEHADQVLAAAEANLPPDLKPGDVHLGGSGGAGGTRQQAADTFAQHLDQLRQSQMGPAVKAVDDYRNNLIALRKEEDAAKATLAQRTEAERDLRLELAKTLNDVVKPWLSVASGGTFGQTDFVAQLQAARQSITDVRAALAAQRALTIPGTPERAPKPPPPQPKPPGTKEGDAGPPPKRRKGPKAPPPPPVPVPGALGGPTPAQLAEAQRNITASFTAQADAAIASFRGLSGGLAQIGKDANDLRGNVLALGLSSDETAKRLAAIDLGQAFQIEQGQLGVLDKLFGYLKGSAKNAAAVEEFEDRKVKLDFQLLQAQMVMYGIWTDANASLFLQSEQAAFEQAHNDAFQTQAADGQQAAASAQQAAAQQQQQTASQFAAATQKLVDYSKSFLTDSSTSFLSARGQVAAAKQQLDQIAAQALAGNATSRDQFQQFASGYLSKFSDVFGKGSAFSAESQSVYSLLQQVIGVQGPAGSAAAGGAGAQGLNYAASGGGVLPGPGYTPPPIAISPTDDPARQAQIKTALDDIKVEATRAAGEVILRSLGFTDSVIQQAEQWAKGGTDPKTPTPTPPLSLTDLSSNVDKVVKAQGDSTKALQDTVKSASEASGKLLGEMGKTMSLWKAESDARIARLEKALNDQVETNRELSSQISRLLAKLAA